jgi:xylulokinase
VTRTEPLTVAGIDVGTSGLKACLVTVVGGDVHIEGIESVAYLGDGTPTRDPQTWVAVARDALAMVTAGRRIDAVGVTGQMHGLVPVAGGKPVRDTLLWNDYDGADALDRFCAAHPELPLVPRTGNIPLPDFTLAKWLHLVECDPSAIGAVERLPAAKDFVRDELSTITDPVTDVNDASGTQYFDPFRVTWDLEIVRAAAIPGSALVPVLRPATIVGTMRTGLGADGAQVVVGTGDQHAAARALGADLSGRASLSLGTSGVLGIGTRLDRLPSGWDGSLHLFPTGAPSMFQVIATVPAFGSTLRWVADALGVPLDDLGTLAEAGRADVVRFYPFLGGSGAPHPDATKRAEFRGLGEDSTRADLARAVIDGLANEIASLIAGVRERGVAIDDLVMSGGPSMLAPLVTAIAARLDMPLSRSSVRDASAVGAALLAADGLGGGDHPVCERLTVPAADHVLPSPQWLDERAAILGLSS